MKFFGSALDGAFGNALKDVKRGWQDGAPAGTANSADGEASPSRMPDFEAWGEWLSEHKPFDIRSNPGDAPTNIEWAAGKVRNVGRRSHTNVAGDMRRAATVIDNGGSPEAVLANINIGRLQNALETQGAGMAEVATVIREMTPENVATLRGILDNSEMSGNAKQALDAIIDSPNQNTFLADKHVSRGVYGVNRMPEALHNEFTALRRQIAEGQDFTFSADSVASIQAMLTSRIPGSKAAVYRQIEAVQAMNTPDNNAGTQALQKLIGQMEDGPARSLLTRMVEDPNFELKHLTVRERLGIDSVDANAKSGKNDAGLIGQAVNTLKSGLPVARLEQQLAGLVGKEGEALNEAIGKVELDLLSTVIRSSGWREMAGNQSQYNRLVRLRDALNQLDPPQALALERALGAPKNRHSGQVAASSMARLRKTGTTEEVLFQKPRSTFYNVPRNFREGLATARTQGKQLRQTLSGKLPNGLQTRFFNKLDELKAAQGDAAAFEQVAEDISSSLSRAVYWNRPSRTNRIQETMLGLTPQEYATVKVGLSETRQQQLDDLVFGGMKSNAVQAALKGEGPYDSSASLMTIISQDGFA